MPAQLVALDDGPSILLDKPILLIGRHPECDIQIDSRKISRRHCCIARVADYLVIRDLGSTNGIRINGTRMQEGRLAEGDEVLIGASRYRVSWDEVPEPIRLLPEPGESVNADEDDLLEASEEPVPLAEPGRPRPIPTPPPLPAAGAENPRGPTREPPAILPDVLELAPSDIFPSGPPHAPGS
jgi:predicted component of type VI protein secretion system